MQRCCFQAHRKLYLALASSPGYITTFSYLRVPSHNFLKLQSGSLYQRRGKCCVLDFRGPVVYCVASRLSAIRHLDVSEYPAGYFRRPSSSVIRYHGLYIASLCPCYTFLQVLACLLIA